MAKPNIKALAIDHGEKIVFGLFGLIVLGVLATSSWSRYDKTPDQLKQQVANARSKISSPENAIWPKAEQEAFKIVDYSERSRMLFTPLASIAMGRFDYSTPLYHPLYRKDEPRREPVFEPVQYLHVVAGTAPLAIAASPISDLPEEGSKTMPDEEMAPANSNDDDPFQARPAAAANANGLRLGMTAPGSAAAGMHGAAGGSASGQSSTKPSGASHGAGGQGAPKGGAHGAGGAGIFAGMPAGMASGSGMLGADVKTRGVRYLAVRGVFPYAKQIENYKKALHISHAEAVNLVEIADFILERQVATSNPDDPWKDAKWTQVSLTTAEEILDECADLDPLDPVPTALKDPVITMPLPLRMLFTWGPAATHPKIKGWELKEDEIKVEDKLIDALTQVASDGTIKEPEKERKRGLANKSRDVKGLVNAAASSSDPMAMMKQLYSKMGSGGGGAPASMSHGASRPGMAAPPISPMAMPGMGGSHGAMMNNMGGMGMGMGMAAMRPGNTSIDRLVVPAQYLLFRYLDFDVEPGLAYRYRVRLQLRNPNFDLTPEELGSAEPEIAKGDERETPWSNISNPEVVPTTVNFYLKQVERVPYNEDKIKPNGSKAVAQLSMFDWDTKLGTVINDVLRIGAIGAFIGDEKNRETLKLDLANEVLDKDKDFRFSTMNVLLDVESDAEIEASQHPDLKLSAADKKGFVRVGLVPEALVATESGEVELLDPYSGRDEEKKWIHQRDKEREGFSVGESKKPASKGLDALSQLNPEQDNGKSDKKDKKGRNSRLKSSQATTGNSATDMMMQMQQMMRNGGGAPGIAPPAGSTTTRGRSNTSRSPK